MPGPVALLRLATGQYVAPEALAAVPADWATASPPYALILVANPDDPSVPVNQWAQLSAGGDPVTGDGWSFGWDEDWDG